MRTWVRVPAKSWVNMPLSFNSSTVRHRDGGGLLTNSLAVPSSLERDPCLMGCERVMER